MKAILMLEDGKSFLGEADHQAEAVGEMIFNTAVVGYQEMMTDPANSGKILILTYPLIGNYGCAPKFNESKNIWLAGMVIKEKTNIFSNWQAKSSFDDFVKEHRLPLIREIDTRTLAVHLRNKGQMLGVISTSCFDTKKLLTKIGEFKKAKKVSALSKISVAKQTTVGNKKGKKVAVLDLGITNGIIKQLENLGLSVNLLPYNTTAQQILATKAKGLIISGGPEEDIGLADVVPNIKSLLGKIPMLGISAGHQVLAKALGAKITKMKLGHHGVNYPMRSPGTHKGEITVQNHSCVVDANSLKKIKNVKITGYNLNDNTVEEMENKKLKVIGAQYCPLTPGLNEVNPIFKRFLKLL